MIRGISTAANGMIAQQTRMDVVANNIANVNTTGFKKDTTLFKSFPTMLIRRMRDNGLHEFPLGSYDDFPVVGRLGTGVEVNEVFTRHDQGSLRETGNQFDLAIEGKGFFSVMTERGERYTRDGAFLLNKHGNLVNAAGHYLLGQNGPITVQKNNFMVDEKGIILINSDFSDRDVVDINENGWENGIPVDKLKIVDFPVIRELKKEGHAFYRETKYSGTPYEVDNYKIKRGFLESSNVNIVNEMVKMIEVQRTYEASQRSVLAHDSLLGKLINDVGSPR